MSQYEKKLKNEMNDEMKLAGLEALVPEELEKHLILNSSRLRTFEDARREILTHVEAKFGLKIRDSKPSDTGLREHSDVRAVNSLLSVEGKGSSVSRVGCLSAMEHIFNETATGKHLSGKGNQGKSWSKSESSITGKGKGQKEHNGKSKGKSKGTKGAVQVSKGQGNGETLKTGVSDLET